MAKNERRNLRAHLRAIDLLFPRRVRARNRRDDRLAAVARTNSFRSFLHRFFFPHRFDFADRRLTKNRYSMFVIRTITLRRCLFQQIDGLLKVISIFASSSRTRQICNG